MLNFFSSLCTLIVSVQLLKIVYNILYNHVIGRILNPAPNFKKLGKWAGKLQVS